MAGSAVVGTLRAVLSAQTADFESAFKSSAKVVEGFESQLAKSQATFKDLEPRITKITSLARDFSGVLEKRSAEEYAQAVEKIGGAARLTEGDQQRVNRAMQEAIGHYRALGQEAPSHILALEQATRKVDTATDNWASVQRHVSSEAENFTGRVKAMALGVFTGEAAFNALVGAGRLTIQFLKDSVGEAMQADKAQRQLTAALQQQALNVPIVREQYDALIKKYEQVSVQTDDALTSTMALLTTVGGVMPAEMDAALSAVTNLASGLGIDLNSATMMVAKSFEDNFGALKKAGVVIDETRAKTEGMTYVLGRVQERFGGQAQSEVQSYAGQIAQLEKQWNNLQETVGQKILQTGILEKVNIGFTVGFALLQRYIEGQLEFVRGAQRAGEEWEDLEYGIRKVNKAAEEGVDDMAALQGSYLSAQRVSEVARQKAADLAAEQKKVADKERQEQVKRYNEEIARLRDLLSGAGLQAEVRKLQDAFHALTPAQRASEEVLRRVGDRAQDLATHGGRLDPVLAGIVLRFHNLSTEAPRVEDGLKGLGTAVNVDLWKRQADAWAAGAVGLGQFLDKFKAFDPSKLGTSILSDFLGGHKDDAKAAAEAERKLNEEFQMTAALIDLVGQSAGGAFGSIMHGASGAISAINQIRTATTAAGTAFGALSLVGNIAETISSLANTGWRRRRQELIDEITHLGGTPDIPAFGSGRNSATDINRHLEEQLTLLRQITQAEHDRADAAQAIEQEASAVARVTQLVDKYGLSFDALGNSIQQAFLTDSARAFADDFEFLISRGADLQTVLEGMGDEAQDFLNRALQFGLEIPASMRPLFQALIESGRLVDLNGEKITDISELNFAETITEGFDRVETAVIRVADVLERAFGGAFATVGNQAVALADKIQGKLGGLKFNVQAGVSASMFPSVEGYATGTQGLQNFGAGTPVVLHGWEEVNTAAQVRARESTMAGVERGLNDISRLLGDLPIHIRSAVQLA